MSLEEEHTPLAVSRRLGDTPAPSYLRDFIYGAVDGAITTFAVVAGVAGANLDKTVVIILGVANLLADGFSMAVSNFLGSRAERQRRERARREEQRHIRLVPRPGVVAVRPGNPGRRRTRRRAGLRRRRAPSERGLIWA